jgi:hypothetical protein
MFRPTSVIEAQYMLVKAYYNPTVDRGDRFIPLSQWDVSGMRSMEGLFSTFPNDRPQNQSFWDRPENDITQWDVRHVTDMSHMFDRQTTFNQKIGNWNVGQVTNMHRMFGDAMAFNQPLNKWDVHQVRDMKYMFLNAKSFNQQIGKWNVSNVLDMSYMFFGAAAFNRSLYNWDVSNVWYMFGMFRNASAFNQPLDRWQVTHVTDIQDMFRNCTSLEHIPFSWRHVNDYSFDSAESVFAGCLAYERFLQTHPHTPANISVDAFLRLMDPGRIATEYLHTRRGMHSQAPKDRARTTALTNPGLFEHIMSHLDDTDDVAKYAAIQHGDDLRATQAQLEAMQLSETRPVATKKRSPASRSPSSRPDKRSKQ